MAGTDRKAHFARFAAKYVPMLVKWAMTDEEYEAAFFGQARGEYGLQIEPAPATEKGVYLVASNGHRLAVIHDETGYASEAVVLSMPESFVDACRPKRGPRALPTEYGCAYHVALPAWMQPAAVQVHWDADYQEKRGRTAPGASGPFWMTLVFSEPVPEDYRHQAGVAHEEKDAPLLYYKASAAFETADDAMPAQLAFRPLVPWRVIFNPTKRPLVPSPVGAIGLNAHYLGDLAYLGSHPRLQFHGEVGQVLVTFDDAPNIRAAIMPRKPKAPEANVPQPEAVQ